MLIADLQFDRHPERLHPPNRLPQQQEQISDNSEASASLQTPSARDKGGESLLRKIVCSLLVVSGLFLFGQPASLWTYEDPFPCNYLSLLVPTWYPSTEARECFLLGIGATLLILGIDNCRMLQIPFEWSFSQYLGDVSFGIYALHVTIKFCFL